MTELMQQAVKIAEYRCPMHRPVVKVNRCIGFIENQYWYNDKSGSTHVTKVKPRFFNRCIFPADAQRYRLRGF